MLRVISIAVFSIVFLTACGTSRPIYNANSQNSVSELSQVEMRGVIAEALNYKRWRILEESKGRIKAGIDVRRHYAEVVIDYTDKGFRINYADSKNLDYLSGRQRIHRNYNKWIQLLEGEIKVRANQLEYKKKN